MIFEEGYDGLDLGNNAKTMCRSRDYLFELIIKVYSWTTSSNFDVMN